MNDNILVVLAFNESLNIENTIIDLYMRRLPSRRDQSRRTVCHLRTGSP